MPSSLLQQYTDITHCAGTNSDFERPDPMETKTVWVLSETKRDEKLLANLQHRFAPNTGLTQVLPGGTCGRSAATGELTLVRFPVSPSAAEAVGWLENLSRVTCTVNTKRIAIESADVRLKDGFVEPMNLRALQLLDQYPQWHLRESVFVVPSGHVSARNGEELAITHRYILIYDRSKD